MVSEPNWKNRTLWTGGNCGACGEHFLKRNEVLAAAWRASAVGW